MKFSLDKYERFIDNVLRLVWLIFAIAMTYSTLTK